MKLSQILRFLFPMLKGYKLRQTYIRMTKLRCHTGRNDVYVPNCRKKKENYVRCNIYDITRLNTSCSKFDLIFHLEGCLNVTLKKTNSDWLQILESRLQTS